MPRLAAIPLAPKPALGELPDAALLDRFLSGKDEAAFEQLLLRHGPGVLRTCRRRLGDGQDAEDACQATFLVLIRRAGAIRQVDDVGAWLRGVARKIGARQKMRLDRDRIRKGAGVDVEAVAGPEEAGYDDLEPALRAEVGRLPEKFRRPIELCYWEGLSNDQAAERLDCPTGTVKWRLSRARELLRDRFLRRGIAMSAFLLIGRQPASAAVPAPSLAAGPHRAGPIGPALADDFIRETVALAVLVRDSLPALISTVEASRQIAARKPARVRKAPKVATLIVAIVALVLSVESLANAVPAETIWRAARSWDARLGLGLVSHRCPEVAPARPLLPAPSSAGAKGLTP